MSAPVGYAHLGSSGHLPCTAVGSIGLGCVILLGLGLERPACGHDATSVTPCMSAPVRPAHPGSANVMDPGSVLAAARQAARLGDAVSERVSLRLNSPLQGGLSTTLGRRTAPRSVWPACRAS
jgi:hypothetical protein